MAAVFCGLIELIVEKQCEFVEQLLRGSVVERQCEVVEQLLRGSVKPADVLT